MYKYQATYKRVLSTLPLLFSFWGKNQCHAILFWRGSFKIDKLQAFCLF